MRDPLRDGFAIAAVAWTGAIALGLVDPGVDAAQFYAHRLPDPYDVADYGSGQGFYYSPVAAVVLYPLTLLGLPVFAATMTGIGFASLYAILGRWAFLGLLFPPVWWDLSSGNINILLGAVMVHGIRYPGLWSIALLTKVTPGIGVLWFAVRREWRGFAIAVGLTGGLALLTLPLWPAWIASLTASAGASAGPGYFTIPIPLLPRLAVAGVLVAVAAWTDRRWLLVIACTLAMPVLWFTALAPLVAVPGLLPRSPAVRLSLAATERSRGR